MTELSYKIHPGRRSSPQSSRGGATRALRSLSRWAPTGTWPASASPESDGYDGELVRESDVGAKCGTVRGGVATGRGGRSVGLARAEANGRTCQYEAS
eukprot:scaffold139590_cov169-Phaeocystis_antarctica.AAC.1